jgi:divalent metal cation (Fe/Co/Zn/Cd) transporter
VLYGLLAGALLIGLAGNAIGGLWWADPVAALVVAAFAWRAGRRLRHDRRIPRTTG